tara:strand:- start:2396 stop:3703 length:1308 start_codon:yes stop_codon:yes gene_type:complete
MKTHLQTFASFLKEAEDPSYYQETFYFTVLIAMNKAIGGSRDETKNDIRALPEILTVTLVEPEKGGVQRDLGTKYLSTLKVHVRKPRDISKRGLMKRVVLHIANLRGVSVLRYKEKKPKPRKRAWHGPGSYKITERGSYQKSRARKARNRRGFDRLTQQGPNNSGPYKRLKKPPTWKSAPPGAPGGLEEDIVITIGDASSDLMAFDIQDDLNQKLWEKDKRMLPGVKGALMDIVDEFLEGLDLEIDVKDVIVTGSIANYNWSKFSDIDVHILIDFSDINENHQMVKKFFDSVRSNWNKLHNITVKGHEVEIYVQAEHEPHVSTGVYSLTDDRWIVKPRKVKPELDRRAATKKMKSIAREIDKLSVLFDRSKYHEAFELGVRIKDKIKKMRHAGLERTGIYSPENLAFKMLRRSGDIEQLFSIYTQAYDKLYSMDQ